jgi:RHS repeat-associated protein
VKSVVRQHSQCVSAFSYADNQTIGKNRLTQVTLPDTTTISYTYDYQNRMVSRTKGTETRTFLHGNGNQVIEETLNGQRLALYGWGADGLVSRTDADGRTLIFLKDGLGSVLAIVDEHANIMQSYEYSAFGENLSGKDAVNAFQFVGGHGGWTDQDTGLTLFWNRWYDSTTGTWVSEDPIRWNSSEKNLVYPHNYAALTSLLSPCHS